jgi:chorismate mutase/prephenate dehydratase
MLRRRKLTVELKNLRRKIDDIDAQLLALLNARAQVSLKVGQAKHKDGRNVYVPEREQQLLARLKTLNAGPMNNEALEAIWREIMSSSLSLEKPLRIAYLGGRGSNSWLAAVRKFGSQLEYLGCQSIPEVFQSVQRKEADYGMVPIENSVEGAVTPTIDMLVDSDLQVCAHILVRISHAFLCKGPVSAVKKVYSNPQVLAQCRNWLLANCPPQRVKHISVAATTDAVKLALTERGAAALASPECARIYGIPIIKADIQDFAHNATRFFVIAHHDAAATGKDRTSIVFSIKDRVGALSSILTPFARSRINLTKIESRPIKKKAWDYYFFLDIEGHREDPKIRKALLRLEGMCKFMKILGSYPV